MLDESDEAVAAITAKWQKRLWRHYRKEGLSVEERIVEAFAVIGVAAADIASFADAEQSAQLCELMAKKIRSRTKEFEIAAQMPSSNDPIN